MKRLIAALLIGLGLFATACSTFPRATASKDLEVRPSLQQRLEGDRGPWDSDRLKAAQNVLNAPARTALEKERQALAAAYVYWGEALFKDFGMTEKKMPSSVEAPPVPTSGQEPNTSAGPGSSAATATPPLWYYADKQQQQLDHMLQQQRDQYYRNRQPPPQFQRPPICNSTIVGGQVYTQCN